MSELPGIPEVEHLDILAQQVSERLRSAKLSPERVAVAAGLHHPAARGSGVVPVRFWGSYRNRVSDALAVLTDREIVEYVCVCTERCLSNWSNIGSDDDGLARSLSLGKMWLSGTVLDSQQLEDLASEIDDIAAVKNRALEGAVPDAPTSSALFAATAAAQLAYTVAAVILGPAASLYDHARFPGGTAVAAAAKSADDYLGELNWQVGRLCQLLLSTRQ